MTASIPPSTELVAKHWLLAAVSDVANKVATTLPDLPWPDDEFIRVASVGGTPDQDVPMLSGVVALECYACRPGSTKPPWGKAASLAMRVLEACYAQTNLYNPDPRVVLTGLPDVFGPAHVQAVKPVTEVRKAPPDPSQYALYLLDIQLTWAPVGLVIA